LEWPVTHLTNDELVLHYYGEDGSDLVTSERHLRVCAQCAEAYQALARTLDSVTAPEVVEVVDDLPTLGQLIRDRMSERSSPSVVALVWLVPLVYPFAIQALFGGGRWAQDSAVGIPWVAIALMWACAGPLLAIVALNHIGVDRTRLPTRVLVVGAVMATIAPSLFLAVSLVDDSLSLNLGISLWYGVVALGGLLALIPWPARSLSTTRMLYVHQLSAAVLTVFVLAHVVNQALAFISLSSYAAMRGVMRMASQQPISYALLVGAASTQIVSGAAMGLKRVRAGAAARNLQAVSGWCLAAFLLVHVLSSLIFRRPSTATTAAVVLAHFNLLATPRLAAQLPFLLLGVAAFLFHVGVYARLAALAYLADASVRRLSYAGAVVGVAVVVTIGLSLCGIHLIN
jgi:succinate dehydrogenase/fumarate reductase cytochrome b subunit